MTLDVFFRDNPKIALGFSGGVDSSYLLYAAIQSGADVKPYFVKSAFQPQFELEDARRLAAQVGAELTVIEADVLSQEAVTSNPANRCYYCKQVIFNLLRKHALADGYTILIDGSNASDDAADRPGMKALAELEVKSPLRVCGLTKQDIRKFSKEAGLFTWDKPAYACLATRVPTGQPLTGELLERVEAAEQVLFAMEFSDFRVRVIGNAARLQFPANQIERAFSCREQILERLQTYFSTVMLDLQTR